MNKKVFMVTLGMSRQGGIEEVSRQVYGILKNNGYHPYPIEMNGSFIFRSIKILQLILVTVFYNKSIFVWMHPHIFEKIKIYPIRNIVWAYGIDVWGDYGKRNTSKLIKADLVISISSFTSKQLVQNGLLPEKIRTISLAIADDSKAIPKIKKEVFEIVTVGRLSSSEQYKGHDLTLHALLLNIILLEEGMISVDCK
jgi:hypothetical protein